MKICFCCHRLPYPPMAGGKRETFKLIESLKRAGHAVDVVTYSDDPELNAEMEDEVECTVHTVPGEPNRTPANLLRNLVSRDPLPVMKADSAEYRQMVRSNARDADVVHLHALQTSFMARDDNLGVPTVLRFNNVKYLIYRQYAGYTSNPAKKTYSLLQYYKTKKYEQSIPEACDLTLTITAEDRERLDTQTPETRVEVLPAGVDPEKFSILDHDPDSPVVTFFGSMDYHPNVDAVRWFVRRILPSIREHRPDLTFEIVGKNPPRSIRTLDDRDGVRVTGFVENLAEHVARAAVVVLPIRVGTGIRMKALHAMAMGKPIVSTSLGVEGINVVDRDHVSLANEPVGFAESVVELLSNADRQQRYRQSARELIEREHDWPTITRHLEQYYETVIVDG